MIVREFQKVTIDLRTAGHFGVSCKSFEMLEFFRLSGFKVDLIMNNWEYMAAASGLTFNSNTKLYNKKYETKKILDEKYKVIKGGVRTDSDYDEAWLLFLSSKAEKNPDKKPQITR